MTSPAAPPGVLPELSDDIEEMLDAEIVRTYNAKRKARLNELWPKPTQGDIESLYHYLQPVFDLYRGRVLSQRTVRYMRDSTPEKWQERLQTERRFRSRLSHNEISRLSGLISRAVPKVHVRPASENQRDMARSQTQTRWARQLLTELGKASPRPVWDQVLDNVIGDGMGAIEFAMREHSIYDDIDAEPEVIPTGGGQYRQETPKEMMRRIDRLLVGAPLPFVVRKIDPLSIYFEEQYDEISRALIVEYKPIHMVFGDMKRSLRNRGGDASDASLPGPGTPGWSLYDTAVAYSSGEEWYSNSLMGDRARMSAEHTTLTIRYYDHRWYLYIVGGVLVDCYEHKLPGLPVFVCPGMVTGSDVLEEMYQGATWGMTDIELTFNDLMTLQVDSAYTFSRPRPVIERDVKTIVPPNTPDTVRLNSPDAPRLLPGETLRDAFAGFENHIPQPLMETLMNLYQMSGLNPIAQGVSPGAGTAGYTVNTQSQAAMSAYQVICRNWGTMLGRIVDFARLTVRDTLKMKVSLAMPSGGANDAGWVWLAPNDVDNVSARVTVDPVADANRQALIAQYSQLNKEGFMPRREVQMVAGAEDPDEWDDQIALDAADQQMLSADIQEAMRRQAFKEQQQTGQGPQNPGTLPAGQPGPQPAPPTLQNRLDALHTSGGAPAPLNAPEVSPEMAAASQGPGPFGTQPGPAPMNSARARAGTPSP